jgi:predicted Zn-dependent protease with MMP-like domain
MTKTPLTMTPTPETPMPSTLAPDAALLEQLGHACLARLPDPFRALVGDVVFLVDEFPDEQMCADLELDSPFDLLGLYTGRPIGAKSVDDSGILPDTIHLFRRPILDTWIETGESLEAIVIHVMIHEVGHHFGLSDADMERIEAQALE